MKRKIVCIMLLSASVIFGMTACGKKEEKRLDASGLAEKLARVESGTQTSQESALESEESEESVEDRKDNSFQDFAGDYFYNPSDDTWAIYVTINEDGSFSGAFHNYNEEISDVDYPNGSAMLCEFNGKFSELRKKDAFTYTCSLVEITPEEEAGTERINQEEGIMYIYCGPYGFEDAKDFEFYLPGKNVADCTQEFLSLMPISYNNPYPDTLFNKAFYSLSNGFGIEEAIDDPYQEVEADYPESLPLDAYELAGSYTNKNLGITMNISVYTDYEEGEEEYGNISWDIPESVDIRNDEATLLLSDNGFDVKPNKSYGEYKIIVTDNTSEKVVIHLYDAWGRDCGEYVMTEHFVS